MAQAPKKSLSSRMSAPKVRSFKGIGIKPMATRVQAPSKAVSGVMPKLKAGTFGQTKVPVKSFQSMKKGSATKVPLKYNFKYKA